MLGDTSRVPSRVARAKNAPGADLDSHRGQIEWLRSTQGQRGGMHLTIRNEGLTLSVAAWRGLLQAVGLQPPCEISMGIGWMRLERQIVVATDPDGEFKITFSPKCRTGMKVGGRQTVTMLADRGVQPGRYPVTLDAENGRLLAQVSLPKRESGVSG